MMLRPALTDILCISCINSIQCSKLRKSAWCPGSTSALTWTMCEWGYMCAKLWSNNCGSYSVRPTPLVEEESIFPNTWSWKEQNFRHVSRWHLKPRTTLLARTSSNLLDCTGLMTYMDWTIKDLEFESRYGSDFSHLHVVQTGPGAHTASYPIGTGALLMRVEGLGHEADHSSWSSAEMKNGGGYTSTPPCLQWHSA
jgi:hypothetical protein